MGLSNPLRRRNVDRMKRMPSKEKMEVTRSVITVALSWLGVNERPILIEAVFEHSAEILRIV